MIPSFEYKEIAVYEHESVHEGLRDLLRRSANLALPLGALHAIAELKVRLRDLETSAIEAARARGATWVDIARALGISRQALHQRMATTLAVRAAEELPEGVPG